MKSPKFVCPNERRLLGTLTEYPVAVRIDDAADIDDAAAAVRESGNELFCVIVQSDYPLSEIELRDSYSDVPLALMAPALGGFRSLAKNLSLLKRLNVRIYLPCDKADNLSALRILASLGIHGCVEFVKGWKDWDALADLMTYAVLGRVPHASIEPFSYIASHYDPHSILDWRLMEFDDPRHFLHLDENGHVAFSRQELRQGIFAAQLMIELGTPALTNAIIERTNTWRDYFVDNHPCAACAGWKICLGRFSDDLDDGCGCASLFSELIEVAAVFKASAGGGHEREIWRP